MALNTNCVLSTVKNTSGSAMKFAFLPPHGRSLAAGEEITVFGNILEAIQRGTAGGSTRITNAFTSALDAGTLDVVSTPSPILYDDVDDASRQLVLVNKVVYAVDTCWTGSSSDAL